MVLLQMLGRSPGHAGVGTVPDVRLQRPLGHLHQRGVRRQLKTGWGKLTEMKPKMKKPSQRGPDPPCSGPVWWRGRRTGFSARCSKRT